MRALIGNPPGTGFGADKALVSVHDSATGQHLDVATVNSTSLTFVAPAAVNETAQDFDIAINNMTSRVRVNYTLTVPPNITAISGDFPSENGVLIVPAVAAAALTISGSGFGTDPAAVQVHPASNVFDVLSIAQKSQQTPFHCIIGPEI